MKKFLTLISFIACVSAWAQSPATLDYQAILRDSENAVISRQSIAITFSILQGENQQTVYSEDQNLTTSAFGLVQTKIGVSDAEAFAEIDWSLVSYVKVEADLGSGLEDFGTSEISAVPFALYGADEDSNPENELQRLSLEGTELSISETNSIDLIGVLDELDAQTLSLDSLSISLSGGNTIDFDTLTGDLTLEGDFNFTGGFMRQYANDVGSNMYLQFGPDREVNAILSWNWADGDPEGSNTEKALNRGALFLYADTVERSELGGVDIRKGQFSVADDGFGNAVGQISTGGKESGDVVGMKQYFKAGTFASDDGNDHFGKIELRGPGSDDVLIEISGQSGDASFAGNVNIDGTLTMGETSITDSLEIAGDLTIEGGIVTVNSNADGRNMLLQHGPDEEVNAILSWNWADGDSEGSNTETALNRGALFLYADTVERSELGGVDIRKGQFSVADDGFGNSVGQISTGGKEGGSVVGMKQYFKAGTFANSDGSEHYGKIELRDSGSEDVSVDINGDERSLILYSSEDVNDKTFVDADQIRIDIDDNAIVNFGDEESSGVLRLHDSNGTNTHTLDGRDGNIFISGQVFENSDRRYKEDIHTLSGTLANIQDLRGVSYYLKNREQSDRKHIGFIAQELEEKYPELVHTHDNGYKSVNYARFTAVLLEALKELNEKVNTLESQNANLKTALNEQDELKSRLSAIEELLGIKGQTQEDASEE